MARTLAFIQYSLFCLKSNGRYLRHSSLMGTNLETTVALATSTMHTHNNSNSIANINWVKSLKTPPLYDVTEDPSSRHHREKAHAQAEAQVSIISWNILAQYHFDGAAQKWYNHVDAQAPVFTWEERLPNILQELYSYDADIICLQEVEFEAFTCDLLPSLQRVGYDGVMQNKKSKDHVCGVSTFWKKGKFRLVDEIHRSRATVAFLEGQTYHRQDGGDEKETETHESILAVTNCHLEGNPTKAVTRVKQLQNILSALNKRRSHHHLIICGDMNCRINQSACTTYLQSGSCQSKDEIIDWWGRKVDKNDLADVEPHSYQLRSAYPIELAEQQPMDYMTFLCAPKCDSDTFVALDQIWYHADPLDSVQVMGLKHPFHSPEHRCNVMKYGLPSVHNPSDHLPVGCVLKFRKWNDVDLHTTKQTEPSYCIKKMSEEELMKKVENILSHITFESKEQKEDLLYIISPVKRAQSRNIKPTEDEIKELRDRRVQKNNLIESVSNDSLRSELEEIFRLMKVVSKRRGY